MRLLKEDFFKTFFRFARYCLKTVKRVPVPQIKPHDVFDAARKTYLNYGDAIFAYTRASDFLQRCGVDPLQPKYITKKKLCSALEQVSTSGFKEAFWKHLREEAVEC